MLPQATLLAGFTLAMLIIATYQVQALRSNAWWLVPHLALGGGVTMLLFAITLWVLSTI